MPVEMIGEFGTPGAEREWIVAECENAIKHLTKICGVPPPEMELEIQWQEHELGEYPTIVLTWEDAMRGAPSEYIARFLRGHGRGSRTMWKTWRTMWKTWRTMMLKTRSCRENLHPMRATSKFSATSASSDRVRIGSLRTQKAQAEVGRE